MSTNKPLSFNNVIHIYSISQKSIVKPKLILFFFSRSPLLALIQTHILYFYSRYYVVFPSRYTKNIVISKGNIKILLHNIEKEYSYIEWKKLKSSKSFISFIKNNAIIVHVDLKESN